MMDGAIIKAGAADTRVRSAPSVTDPRPWSPPPDPGEAERLALRDELEVLAGRLQERDGELHAVRSSIPQLLEEAEARGRLAGAASADLRESERILRLEAGVQMAVETIAAELASLERLSALIALEAVRKICGEGAERNALVQQIVRVQLAGLAAQQVVSVLVSRADFPNDASIGPLQDRQRDPPITFLSSEHLKSGDCQIKLKLGALDVGVDQQWAALQDLLHDLAQPEAAS